ncbi:hypothetical protein VDG1235_1420 [Verrucomicrobiia bacterium DG1235]|nr:hypothetical protein VDG1235_1420 [Verrucomicrobiae bacterium DG1235]
MIRAITAAALTLLLHASSFLTSAQELKPPLLFNHQIIEPPESVHSFGIEDAALFEDGSIVISTFDNTYYRNEFGAWKTPPSPLRWTVQATEVIGGFDTGSNRPAVWFPNDPDNEYTVLENENLTPLGVADNGTMLLLHETNLDFYLWSNLELKPVIEVYPALGELADNLRYIQPDGKLYGFTKPTSETFVPFTFSQGVITTHDALTLSSTQILAIEAHSPFGNILSAPKDAALAVWGPAFDQVVLLQSIEPKSINDLGESLGILDRGLSSILDKALYWNFEDGYLDLDTLILKQSSLDNIHFYNPMSINNDRSILAWGVRLNEFSRVSELYLLKPFDPKSHVDLSFAFESNGLIDITALPHFSSSSVIVKASSDLKNWQTIEPQSSTKSGPTHHLKLDSSSHPGFYKIAAIPED